MDKSVQELQTRLNRKVGEASVLHELLQRSLSIQYLWPEAFNCGSAEGEWSRIPASQIPGVVKPHHFEFTIRRPDGEVRQFTGDEVPPVLWTAEISKELGRRAKERGGV